MTRVVITELEYRKGREVFDASGFSCFAAPEDETSLAAAVRECGARHAIVGVAPYTSELYGAIPAGGVLARFGVGHDGIDKDKATARGIFCTNTPGVLVESVAEHTMALALAASRRVAESAAAMREGQWRPSVGYELWGKTLAIIGCGAIGQRVAQIAAFGFGMTVVGCDRETKPLSSLQRGHGFARMEREFAAAVKGADYVSLHVPALPSTHHLINRTTLAEIPPRAVLINTARGAIIDEEALHDALAEGRLGAAALDVFTGEPYAPQNPAKDLRRLSNVILTPHISSSTHEANRRMAERAVWNIRLAEEGRRGEMDLLNPEVLG